MRKAFAFYFLVQIYASGSLTPVIRNDNVNNNEALQSHILSFSLDFAAKLYRLLKLTKHMRIFFFRQSVPHSPPPQPSLGPMSVLHAPYTSLCNTPNRATSPTTRFAVGHFGETPQRSVKNTTFALYEGTVLYRCRAFVLLGGR